MCRRLFSIDMKRHRSLCDIATCVSALWCAAAIFTLLHRCDSLRRISYEGQHCSNTVGEQHHHLSLLTNLRSIDVKPLAPWMQYRTLSGHLVLHRYHSTENAAQHQSLSFMFISDSAAVSICNFTFTDLLNHVDNLIPFIALHVTSVER